jgi:hypothetical protein
MIKGRQALADALARLIFEKPLAELDHLEPAELNFLRAHDADAGDEERYEQLAKDRAASRGATLH